MGCNTGLGQRTCFKEQQMFSSSDKDRKLIEEKNKILNKRKISDNKRDN